MKTISMFVVIFCLLSEIAFAQSGYSTISLEIKKDLVPFNVIPTEIIYQGKQSIKVIDTGENTELKFVKINNLEFKNGIIEIDVAGKPSEGSSEQARGFVGVAFRINNDNSKFECIYIRPTNGRAEDQVRRNHSVQYISFPDFPWFKLRKDFPEKFESYVDLVPGEWTRLRIEIKDASAKLFVHENTQPSLIVNDLKHGADFKGSIGLWIGPGTEAYFSNLRVKKMD